MAGHGINFSILHFILAIYTQIQHDLLQVFQDYTYKIF